MNYSELLQLINGWGYFNFYRVIIWRLRFSYRRLYYERGLFYIQSHLNKKNQNNIFFYPICLAFRADFLILGIAKAWFSFTSTRWVIMKTL